MPQINKVIDLPPDVGVVTGLYQIPNKGVWIPVRIVAVRAGFGRLDCLVRPIDGKGEMWVHRQAVELDRPLEVKTDG